MIVETIFMALVLTLLLLVAYNQYRILATTQVTLAMLYAFIESVEEEAEEYGQTQQLH